MKNIFKHKSNKISLDDITIEDLKKEIHYENYKHSFARIFRSTLYILLIIVSLSIIVATIIMPVVEVTETSMNNINNGDIVLTLKTSKINKGDIIAFYHGNKILIKKVVAVSGEYVNIDNLGSIYINGEKLEEYNDLTTNRSYPLQVSNESVYALSDNINNENDSRNEEIGDIKKENIIGKVILRVWPIKNLKIIK